MHNVKEQDLKYAFTPYASQLPNAESIAQDRFRDVPGEEQKKIERGIKSWSDDDKPREKAIAKGWSALTDAELLAILIGTGCGDKTAVDLGRLVMKTGGNNLENLAKFSIADFTKTKGIGEAKAITMMAAFEIARRKQSAQWDMDLQKPIRNSQMAYEYFKKSFSDQPIEMFNALLLNVKSVVIGEVQVAKGGVSAVLVDMRALLKPAIEKMASFIIVGHNHPSGDPTPSDKDNELTKKIVAAARTLDIKVVDHIIFTDYNYFSYADQQTSDLL